MYPQSGIRINFQAPILLIAGLLFLFGCSSETGYKQIDFSQTMQVESPEPATNDKPKLRVAVAAMISPKETLSYYRELLDYIGRKLGRDIILIQRRTYGEINELFPKMDSTPWPARR